MYLQRKELKWVRKLYWCLMGVWAVYTNGVSGWYDGCKMCVLGVWKGCIKVYLDGIRGVLEV